MLGAIVPVSDTIPHRFEAQLGVGYLFQSKVEGEDKVGWNRIPFEAIYFYHNTSSRFRLGWGGIYHALNELTGKGKYANVYAKADDAFGFVVAAEKNFNVDNQADWTIGIRYQWIGYNAPLFSSRANGDAFFVTFSVY